jgi:hypothetical protein
MIERIAKAGRLGLVVTEAEKLPYSIELWDSGGQVLERVVSARSMRSLPERSFTRHGRNILRREFCCAEGRGRSRIPPTNDQYFGSRSKSSIETPSGPRIKQIRTPGRTVVGSRVNSTPFFFNSAATASMPLTARPK